MQSKLPEDTIENVWREVSRCMNELVGGSGHLSSYSMLVDSFEIARWEEQPDGRTRYWFGAKAIIETEFTVYTDDDNGPQPESVSGSIVLTPDFDLAVDEEGKALFEPWRTTARPHGEAPDLPSPAPLSQEDIEGLLGSGSGTEDRQVTIDGPAASGKSTVAQQVAERMGAYYINTGLMYRTLTWVVKSRGIDPVSAAKDVETVLPTVEILYELREGKLVLTLDGSPVDLQAVRHPEVTALVSHVAKIPAARAWMVERQRRSAQIGWIVAEGRDMGTVVFPNARYKFYLSASPEERARRRLAQDGETADGSTLASVASEIAERDRIDSTREVAPLRPADDARQIDTTGMTIEEVVDTILNVVEDL